MRVSRNVRSVLTIAAIVLVLALVYAAFTMSAAPAADRVLLVASDVLASAGGPERFQGYLADQKVAVVPYNYDRVAPYAELADLVKAQASGAGASAPRSLKSVGLMYHTPNRYSLQCFASDPAKSTVDGSPESFESFRRFVAALRATYGIEDLDLISCDVVSNTSGVLASLDYGGARVNASTNTTGQAKGGPVGDWVLEMGNAGLIGTYFNGTITQSDIVLAPTPTPTPTLSPSRKLPLEYVNPESRAQYGGKQGLFRMTGTSWCTSDGGVNWFANILPKSSDPDCKNRGLYKTSYTLGPTGKRPELMCNGALKTSTLYASVDNGECRIKAGK
jgi:hypothetical protein